MNWPFTKNKNRGRQGRSALSSGAASGQSVNAQSANAISFGFICLNRGLRIQLLVQNQTRVMLLSSGPDITLPRKESNRIMGRLHVHLNSIKLLIFTPREKFFLTSSYGCRAIKRLRQ